MAAQQNQEVREEVWLRTVVTVRGKDVPCPKETWEWSVPVFRSLKHDPTRFEGVVVRKFGPGGRLTLEFEDHVFEQHVLPLTESSQFWVHVEMPGDNYAPFKGEKLRHARPDSIYTDAVEGAWWGCSRKLPNGWRVTYVHEVFTPLRRQITGPTTVPSKKRARESVM